MQEASRSLRDKAKHVLVFSPKERIDNPHFGLGTIVTIDEHYITIRFDESGVRKFVTSMVTLAPSDVPKPAKRGRAGNKVKQQSA